MFNKIFIDGHLVRDIEIRQTANGILVGKFTIGHNHGKDKSSFFDVVCFDKLAEWNEELKKGDKAIIEGRLQQQRWEDGNGNKKNKIVIVADKILRKPKKQQQEEYEPGVDDFNYGEWE